MSLWLLYMACQPSRVVGDVVALIIAVKGGTGLSNVMVLLLLLLFTESVCLSVCLQTVVCKLAAVLLIQSEMEPGQQFGLGHGSVCRLESVLL